MPINISPWGLQLLSTTFLAVILVAISDRFVRHLLAKLKRPPYPPGPKPRWLIGNLYDIPTNNPAEEYINWGKEYDSNILHASALGTHIIVLNKLVDVQELFERRGEIYSDRPPIPMLPLLGWGYNVGFMNYGTSLRLHRKICKQDFGQSGVKTNYESIITDRVGHVIRGLATSPDLFKDICTTFGISIPLASMYGYSVQSLSDPIVAVTSKANAIGIALILPGSTLISVVPLLKYIPSWIPVAGSTRRKAEEVGAVENGVYDTLIGNLRDRIMTNPSTPEPSLIGRIMTAEAKGVSVPAAEAQASMGVARTLYTAASNTISFYAITFIYLMAVNPEIQSKAQIELDHVVGAYWRVPNFGDRENLPYIEALCREVLRWKLPGPLALPHYLREDDVYKGFLFPKGSIVFPNLEAICNDEELYTDPSSFNPERHFDGAGRLLESDLYVAFGIGRRACPGVHLGSASLWLFIATILACFDIKKARDAEGNEIEIKGDYDDMGITRHKKDFQCSIIPRSAVASELIADTAASA